MRYEACYFFTFAGGLLILNRRFILNYGGAQRYQQLNEAPPVKIQKITKNPVKSYLFF
jgi:hypothetical protein